MDIKTHTPEYWGGSQVGKAAGGPVAATAVASATAGSTPARSSISDPAEVVACMIAAPSAPGHNARARAQQVITALSVAGWVLKRKSERAP